MMSESLFYNIKFGVKTTYFYHGNIPFTQKNCLRVNTAVVLCETQKLDTNDNIFN